MPVTDEQSPELKDFDMLIQLLLPEIVDAQKHPDASLSFVFNCQMGRGRTTTGMVVCCLLIGASCRRATINASSSLRLSCHPVVGQSSVST
jgi:protein-tyrosine phosphatase